MGGERTDLGAISSDEPRRLGGKPVNDQEEHGKSDYSAGGLRAGAIASAVAFVFVRDLDPIATICICYLASLIGYLWYVGSKKSTGDESWNGEEILVSFLVAWLGMWGAGALAILFLIIGI